MAEPAPALLAGRRGLVVGVSSERSLGFACAQAARALGAEVMVTYRPARRETVPLLAERLGCALHAPLDLDTPETIAEVFALIAERWERLDFLVHTLMHVPPSLLAEPLTAIDGQRFARVLEVGVHSLLVLCRHAQPLLARSPAPRVVTLSSPCSQRMTPHYHVAGIAKAALESAVRYLAQELGPAGVLVNAVSPALIDTDGAVATVGREAAAATRAHLAKKAATRQPPAPADVGDCVAFLCSSWARQITGEVIAVDGGYARNYF